MDITQKTDHFRKMDKKNREILDLPPSPQDAIVATRMTLHFEVRESHLYLPLASWACFGTKNPRKNARNGKRLDILGGNSGRCELSRFFIHVPKSIFLLAVNAQELCICLKLRTLESLISFLLEGKDWGHLSWLVLYLEVMILRRFTVASWF